MPIHESTRISRFAIAVVLASSLFGASDPSTVAREIVYHETDLPIINTQAGYVTAIYLPSTETIMMDDNHPMLVGLAANKSDEAIGFQIEASGNVLYIKPKDVPKWMDPNSGGKATNLSITLASGSHVDLVVHEVSKVPGVHADLKVFLRFGDRSMVVASESAPKFIPAAEKAALEQKVADQQTQLQALQDAQKAADQSGAVKEADSVSHAYGFFDHKGKEKITAAIWRDKTFTYVDVHDQEKPTVWEVKDGKPAKVESLWQGDRLTIQHLIDTGEIRAGKSSVKFRYLKEEN